MRNLMIHALLVGSFSVTLACSNPLTPESIAGTYVATRFTYFGELTGDVLEAGGNLTLVLNADGTTTGSMFVPGSLNAGMDFNVDMAGTFTLVKDSLSLVQPALSYIPYLAWTVSANKIDGSGNISGVTITVVLSRQ